jgi:hypothetical protein
MPARFDASEWPLLLVRLEGRDDEQAVNAMLAGLDEHPRRGRCVRCAGVCSGALPIQTR